VEIGQPTHEENGNPARGRASRMGHRTP